MTEQLHAETKAIVMCPVCKTAMTRSGCPMHKAAPELLEALEDMHSAMVWLVAQLPNDETIANYNLDQAEAADLRAQAAIAKARGK